MALLTTIPKLCIAPITARLPVRRPAAAADGRRLPLSLPQFPYLATAAGLARTQRG